MIVSYKQAVLDRLVDALTPRLAARLDSVSYDSMDEKRLALVTSFDELRQITRIEPQFPSGLDFRSGQPARNVLYGIRIQLAELRCWWAAVHGVGLKWTSHNLLGYTWFENMQMTRARNRAENLGKNLMAIAVHQSPPHLQPTMREWARGERSYRRQIASTLRGSRKKLKQVRGRRLLSVPAPIDVPTCSRCRKEIPHGTAFKLDGKGGVCHHPRYGGCSPYA